MNRNHPQVDEPQQIILPQHVLNDRKAQQEMIISATQQGYQDAYHQTIGAIGDMVKDTARRLEIALSLLNSSVMAHGLPDENLELEVSTAFELADMYASYAQERVTAMQMSASSKLTVVRENLELESAQPEVELDEDEEETNE